MNKTTQGREIEVLQAIEDAGGQYDVAERLAKQLKISKAYVSNLLTSLERKRLITKESHEGANHPWNSYRLTLEGKQWLQDRKDERIF